MVQRILRRQRFDQRDQQPIQVGGEVGVLVGWGVAVGEEAGVLLGVALPVGAAVGV